MLNAISVNPMVQIGIMNAYFEDILNQFSSNQVFADFICCAIIRIDGGIVKKL